jgi:hypothetical protein
VGHAPFYLQHDIGFGGGRIYRPVEERSPGYFTLLGSYGMTRKDAMAELRRLAKRNPGRRGKKLMRSGSKKLAAWVRSQTKNPTGYSRLAKILEARYGVGLLAAPPTSILWAADHLADQAGLSVARRELSAANRRRESQGKMPAVPDYGSRLFARNRARSNPVKVRSARVRAVVSGRGTDWIKAKAVRIKIKGGRQVVEVRR